MQLQLERPLVFFDLETTGVNPASDRIVEISMHKLQPNGTSETKTMRLNPTIEIPKESSDIHGITNEMVANEPTFAQVAKKLFIYLSDSDLAGYNSNKFDVPLLVEEFFRAGYFFDLSERNLIDVQNIFHKMEQRTLAAAYEFYCNKKLENAHSAEADNLATYEVFLAQLERYKSDLKPEMKFLHEFSKRNKNADLAGRFSYNEKNEVVFNFGKHKGKAASEVFKSEPSYYSWMMRGEFPFQTKKLITDIWNETFEKQKDFNEELKHAQS